MPGKVGVKIKAGRNLPVMDRGSDTTDAYVEIKLGNVTHKTDVCRKSLNPQWNTDWFRFEVDDAELQDEPLQIRLMDHDTYSANDAIGKVNISLNPLCLETAGQSNQGKGAVMSGWIPVFDTMHGIRGEVNIIVKVDLFSDVNKFRQSSCGVQFFHSPCVPHGYRAQIIHGFVEELVVNDDPEYQWIDKIRTPRASNEARQVVFLRLSGQVQRKIGLKAINLGANAVIGYTQCFDLEGDVGVVARGIGTAVTLVKIQENPSQLVVDNALIEERTKKYLEFLSATSNYPHEKIDIDDFDEDPMDAVYKILGLDPLDKTSARSPKIILKKRWKPSAKDEIIYEENTSENDYSMQQLLQQEDMRGEKPQKKIHHHLKKLTHQSKSLISDKVGKQLQPPIEKDKTFTKNLKALHGSYSDLSISNSLRNSLTDIRNLIAFSKSRHRRSPKKNFQRSVSDGSNMATLLVSSVMRGPSLNKISEQQDQSKLSYLRHSTDESSNRKSESISNLTEAHSKFPAKNKICESVSDIEKLMHRDMGEIDRSNIESSHNSISSISVSCSSTSEEGFSDELSETTTPNEIASFDPDTVSMVVKTVLAKELENKLDSSDWIQPGSTQDSSNENLEQYVKAGNFCTKFGSDSSSSSIKTVTTKHAKSSLIVNNTNDNNDKSNKISNDCKTNNLKSDDNCPITTGGTRVMNRDSKRSENYIVSNKTSYEKLEILLKKDPAIDEDSDNWIEPGSTTNEPETIDTKRRSSLMHGLKDNIAGKLHYLQEHMHLPHLSDHKTKHNRDNESVHSPKDSKKLLRMWSAVDLPQKSSETQLHKSSSHGELNGCGSKPTIGKRRFSIDLIIKTLHLPIHQLHHHNHPQDLQQVDSDVEKSNEAKLKSEHKDEKQQQKHRHSDGLLGTAMRSMLMETISFAEELGHEQKINEQVYANRMVVNPYLENLVTVEYQQEKMIEKEFFQQRNEKSAFAVPHSSEMGNDSIKATHIIPPKAIIIQPSTPTPSPDNTFNSFIHPSLDHLFLTTAPNTNTNSSDNSDTSSVDLCSDHVDKIDLSSINVCQTISHNNNDNNTDICMSIAKQNHDTVSCINKSNNNTSLDTFYLSFSTNKAHTLIPSAPSSIQQHLRSSTELALSSTTSTTNGAGNNSTGNSTADTTTTTSSLTGSIASTIQHNPSLKSQTASAVMPQQSSESQSNIQPQTQQHQLHNFMLHQNRQQNIHALNQSMEAAVAGRTNLSAKGETTSSHTGPIQQAAPSSGHIRAESVGTKMSSPVKINGSSGSGAGSGHHTSNNSTTGTTNSKNAEIFRRSSDSDLSVTPKGNSICVASDRLVAATTLMRLSAPVSAKIATAAENLDMLEYPFLTMAKYPTGFILHLGATVAARSVKLLERVPNLDEPETRDSWWTEIRMEIRSHARALGCNVILGYAEVTTISDDVCVLSATGTAAVINMSYSGDSQFDFSTNSKKDTMTVSSLDERECLKEGRNSVKGSGELLNKDISSSFSGHTRHHSSTVLLNRACGMCHVPYTVNSVPVSVKIKCAICKRGKVPDVLMATIEIPECLQITGRGCFMQAQVVRAKKDLRSESNAKEISDGLPFLEYELHRLLINKLKAKGMNAIFGLKTQVAVGEKMMALIATGTAVFLTSLPTPTVPKVVAGNSWNDDARLNELQKKLQETVEKNREIYQLKNCDPDFPQQNGKQSDTDESEDELLELDLNAGNKGTCVLEVDDIEDLEIIMLLMETCPPEGFHIVNTQAVPGLHDMEVVRNLQMFTQVWRAKIAIGQNTGHFPKHFQRLLQTIFFKLRTMIPCAVCDLKFQLELPESDEIQILVTGMTLGLAEPKHSKQRRKTLNPHQNSDQCLLNQTKKSGDDEMIFSLDEDQTSLDNNQLLSCPPSLQYGSHSLKLKKNSPSRAKFCSVRYSRHLPLHERYGVDITPLSYIPGGKIEKYLGNLNFFFIRESTSIRENGGISGFVHGFITELLAVVRSHVSALGGNAMISFYMTELILVDNQHKNQGQCLISIGGDVVYVSYYADD